MRFSKALSSGFVAGVIALLTLPAFGQSTRSLSFTRDAKLGGQTITSGKYTLSFDESKEGELAIERNGKEVAKAAYKLVSLEKAAPDNAIVYKAASDGSLIIKRIEIKGMKMALSFE